MTCTVPTWWLCRIHEVCLIWNITGLRLWLSVQTLSNCWSHLGLQRSRADHCAPQQRETKHYHDPSSKPAMLQRGESGFKSSLSCLRSPILPKETKQNTHAVIKRINTGPSLCCKPGFLLSGNLPDALQHQTQRRGVFLT